ncbi:MAG: neutral/alkaline non-lysosomal ceramidase N-terminal domain-containing protein [Planctomycetota bacterium]
MRFGPRVTWGVAALVFALAATATNALPGAEPDSPKGKSAAQVFKAGAAASNVTPWLDEPVVGGWKSAPAEHIHDELWARCLVLDNGDRRLAIVLVDNLSVGSGLVTEAKRQIEEKTGLPPRSVLIAATHTHSSIAARAGNELKPEVQLSEYARFVARRVADGVRRAVNQLEPARIAWGAGIEEKQVFNRRWFLDPEVKLHDPFGGTDQVQMNPGANSDRLLRPAGPVDPQVSFLAVQSVDGRPIALLANYSLHYVGGVGPGHISADYFGAFADRMQELLRADRLDPPFVAMMSNGTSGDINNINFREKRKKQPSYEQIRTVADSVAQAVAAEYEKAEFHSWVPLGAALQPLELAVRKPTPAQLARAKELLAGAKPMPERPHEETYAGRLMSLEEARSTVEVPLQAMRIGELGIVGIPFETFAEIGLELKARSPLKPMFTIELANGGFGYLPTPEQHALGGYETWLGTNKVETEASRKIIEQLLVMLESLKQE